MSSTNTVRGIIEDLEHDPKIDARATFEQILERLEPHEARALRRIHGLGGSPQQPKRQVAAQEGLTSEQISAIYRKFARELKSATS